MEASLFDRLTERQRSCLRLVGALANSKEIARELGISRHTVDEHIRVAMATLGLSSRYEAARALAAHEGRRTPSTIE
ncbi:MAG: helix-turn-helix transcriptional regulator [Sphingomonas sp.]